MLRRVIKGLVLLAVTVVSMNSWAGEYPKDVILLKGEFNKYQVDSWIEEIDSALEGKPKGYQLDIYLDSPGGEVFAGNRLIHSIMRAQSKGYKIRGIAVGQCMSMCFVTLQYLDNRVAYPHAWLLDHDVQGTDHQGAINAVSEMHRHQIAKRLKNIDPEAYRLLVHRELWLSPRLAIKFGLLDGIVFPGFESPNKPELKPLKPAKKEDKPEKSEKAAVVVPSKEVKPEIKLDPVG